MAPSEQLDYQISTIRGLIEHTSTEQLNNPTPCAKWTVRDLINHMVAGGHLFGSGLKGDDVTLDPDDLERDFVGDDPVAAWDGATKAFCEGVDTPGALDRVITMPFGEVPGSVVLEIGKFDLLVHAWDLAQATGQKLDPPADIVEPAIGAAQMIIAPTLRNGDTFCDAVDISASATPIERLAAFAGRTV